MRRELQKKSRDWKPMVTEGLYRTGLLRAFHTFSQRYELGTGDMPGRRLRRAGRAKYVVLGYHRIGTEGVPLYCDLPQSAFAEQMRYITRHYRVVSMQQMTEELEEPNISGQAVVVTFDDGYLGTYTEAFPVLQRYNIPATLYLTAGAVESGEILWYDRIFLQFQRASSELNLMLGFPRTYKLSTYTSRIEAAAEVIAYLRSLPDDERQAWCAELERMIPLCAADLRGAMMTWKQARLMQRAGIAFGSHTMTHPVASRLRFDRLQQEVSVSKQLIEERLGEPVVDFAFPFGKAHDCGRVGAADLQPHGIKTALTSITGVNKAGADLYRLRRVSVSSCRSLASFALSLQRIFFCQPDEELPVSSGGPETDQK